MTNPNSAAQAANENPLSDEYVNAIIQRHGYDSPECVIARLHQWIGLHGGENGVTLLMYEAHKALSKLRAPVVDERKPVAKLRFGSGGGMPSVLSWNSRPAGTYLVYDRPDDALASAPVADRQRLRELVDVVWNEATESTAVPDTPWSDRLIDKVFPPLAASAPVAGEPFMYGIMGPDGKARFEEFCVSGDRDELQAEVVDHLNRDNPEDGSYSVVALFRDAAPQASTEARPSLDAVDLARAGMALHAPGAPEHTVCAELVRLADALKQPQADKAAAPCTCPSGDGSLRHPCPAHPQTNEGRA